MNKREEILNDAILQHLRTIAESSLPENAKLILYGSRARGDAHANSDWDLLIIIDQVTPLNLIDCSKATDVFLEYGWNNNIEINPLVLTSRQWERQQHTLFYHNIQKEGITLWA